jgi:hypothetical protein
MNRYNPYYLLIIPIWFFLLGCATDKYHNIEFYAPFFYDSSTIGVIRIEYDMSSRQGVTGTETDNSNVDQWIDFIDIASINRTKSIPIAKNMGGTLIPEGKFVAPWFLYHTGKDRHIEMMNIETRQRWKILDGFAHLNGISSKGNYALVDNTIYKRDDGSIYRSFDYRDNPVYFDEDSMMVFAGITTEGRTDYVKIYLTQNKSDTLFLPPQIDVIKTVDWNRYMLFVMPEALPGGDITRKALVVKTGLFLIGDLSTAITGRIAFSPNAFRKFL